MTLDNIPDQLISKDDRDFFKLQLAAAFKAREEAQKNKIDTTENLKTVGEILKSAENCIGGTFTSSIKGGKAAELQDKIKKTKTSSKFVTTVKKWANKFVELCKSPSSVSRKKDLKQETEVLYNGSKIIQIGNLRTLSQDARKATDELRKTVNKNKVHEELKAKFNKAPQQDAPGKSKLQRSKPVTKKTQSKSK